MEEFTREETMEGGCPQISAQALSEHLSRDALDAQREDELARQEEQEEMQEALREGIGELFEDGWTTAELAAMCCDEAARAMIAKGASVARAACAYLKKSGGLRKGAVPTARMAAAGMQTQENAIERMTDEEFAAFAARANEAMKAGKKVRI